MILSGRQTRASAKPISGDKVSSAINRRRLFSPSRGPRSGNTNNQKLTRRGGETRLIQTVGCLERNIRWRHFSQSAYMDRISPERRSWNMSQIRSRDTAPEKRVRSLLHRLGFRFSLRRNDLPGKPDIVLAARRTVVFVHGCFWHQHEGCSNATMPKARRVFWEAKLKGNELPDEQSVATRLTSLLNKVCSA